MLKNVFYFFSPKKGSHFDCMRDERGKTIRRKSVVGAIDKENSWGYGALFTTVFLYLCHTNKTCIAASLK